MQKYIVVAAVLVCVASKKIPSLKEQEAHGDVPPPPIHNGLHAMQLLAENSIDTRTNVWNPNSEQNAWQLSGLREGDIMEDELESRNALVEAFAKRWPEAVVPYAIRNDFNENQKNIIHGAFDEIQNKSCVRFHPYKTGDVDYVDIRKDAPGCWSYHGRTGGGQTLNLGGRGCIFHETVVHELLHALGFVHQQSVSNRDTYIKVNWDNIVPHQRNNFKKRPRYHTTDYGIPYDYQSIMHYDQWAFTTNDLPTMTPLKPGITGDMIGRAMVLSDGDIKKLNIMYNCKL